jgi:hypothetical protein
LDALSDAIANLTEVFAAETSKQASALNETTIEEFPNAATGRLDAHAG